MARPLNKRYLDGTLYSRPEKIESSINRLLTENIDAVTQRIGLPESSPNYIASECLVHLIRDARRRDDEPTMTALLPPLLRRCEIILLSKISNNLPYAEEIREEILGQFSELFAADGVGNNPDELDFFEVHFNQAFRTFRIDIVRHERRRESVRGQGDLPVSLDEAGDPRSDDEFFVRLSKEFHAPSSQEGALILGKIKEAIDALPADERKAVILCHIMGYEQESDDPEKITAATICGVTGRTIRNRLNRAAARLSSFKELIP